ncbi:MAG: hypothetical protein JNK05_07785 [Myxococcales bacterium]|nr:hypothetical protein [Myxococcales bacterium]
MRTSLKIPSTLAVVLSAGCAPNAGQPDAARDVVAVAVDSARIERIDGGCYVGERYTGTPRACLPSYPATRCAAARSCRSSECGENCATCAEVFQCFPMVIRPDGDAAVVADAARPRCDSPAFTCNRYGCEPGCQTIPAPIEGGGGIG